MYGMLAMIERSTMYEEAFGQLGGSTIVFSVTMST